MKQETKTVEKQVKPKVDSLRKSNKINQSLARLIIKIREKTQMTNISNERVNIITDSTYIKRIIKRYYKQHAYNCDNLDEMDKFLQRHKLHLRKN